MFRSTNDVRMSEYFWRVTNLSQMDFNFSFSQMMYLITSPSLVYKHTTFRKQIKNQWARDDPAFLVLLCYFLSAASLSFCVGFGVNTPSHFLRMVAGSVFIELIGFGVILSTAFRYIANTYLNQNRVLSVKQEVEW